MNPNSPETSSMLLPYRAWQDLQHTNAVYCHQALAYPRNTHVVVPPLRVIDRVCSQSILRANLELYRRLVRPLTECPRKRPDELLTLKPSGAIAWLLWLRQSSMSLNSQSLKVGIIGNFTICATSSLHKRALQVGYELLWVLTKSHHFTKRFDLAINLSPTDLVCSIVIVPGTGIDE